MTNIGALLNKYPHLSAAGSTLLHGKGAVPVEHSTSTSILKRVDNLFAGRLGTEEGVTFVQLIMTGIFACIAYILLQVFADFGAQSAAVQFGGFAAILVLIIVTVRKMFPG